MKLHWKVEPKNLMKEIIQKLNFIKNSFYAVRFKKFLKFKNSWVFSKMLF